MNVIKHFVNGQLFDGNSKRKGKVFNPATGDQSSEVNLATTNDVNTACLLYTSPSPRDRQKSRMPSSA